MSLICARGVSAGSISVFTHRRHGPSGTDCHADRLI
jgi:hypothetical protein